ncbi:crossover junction endodeoxyribonuclease RuvC [Magnetovibrio blakemorei]|uniref:Crossover junction endodeoxyribonuclease RuvC n=1 Tax=Magnetovibrio blakemorei TaxID=28181 RepID=A0A1E5QA56_9PROT|nr:crossover junction endodeoxyribonuclease RuvC [Magnetovibrio blakemorei]OEJ68670.1 crossover junction endodeoxyribonuclease RuvC [Magnetovibrio blakemorei]
MRIIGIDPGLQRTGWGVIDARDNRLSFVAEGTITSSPKAALADRLMELHDGLVRVIELWKPEQAAVEETFVNKNPTSTLKLGQARGIALLVPARLGLAVGEYTPNMVKKSVVGAGHAAKEQVQMMVKTLLPGSGGGGPDAADALAVAICHAHLTETQSRINAAGGGR